MSTMFRNRGNHSVFPDKSVEEESSLFTNEDECCAGLACDCPAEDTGSCCNQSTTSSCCGGSGITTEITPELVEQDCINC